MRRAVRIFRVSLAMGIVSAVLMAGVFIHDVSTCVDICPLCFFLLIANVLVWADIRRQYVELVRRRRPAPSGVRVRRTATAALSAAYAILVLFLVLTSPARHAVPAVFYLVSALFPAVIAWYVLLNEG